MKRRKKKRGFDIGTLAIGIMGMLMTVVPIAFLIYMYITKTRGMCQIDGYGEPTFINCSELITIPIIVKQYETALYLIIYGIFCLSQFFLSCGDDKKTKIYCTVVIALYFVAWILAIYLTSSFLKSLVMLSLHHFWFVAALGIMASEISKKR